MRSRIYNLLVNRQPGITYRYHRFHDGTAGAQKILSWLYLIWLNVAFYVFFCRFLGNLPQMDLYEEKRLNCKTSESQEHCEAKDTHTVSEYAEKLLQYDVVSFDVFDTLIFRPAAAPTDMFYLIGQKFDLLDFKNIRIWAEWDARQKCKKKNGHMEVTLQDIWKNLEEETGLSAEEGMRAETETEEALCYANPFMLEVWKKLEQAGKKRIIVSDMYLPEDCITRILEHAGFTGADRIYVSNAYAKNKAGGDLFRQVRQDYAGKSMIHVGDNPHSDKEQALQNGLAVFPYQNVNKNIRLYRAEDMSPIIGGAYRGLVAGHLYNGLHSYGIDYEYGFIYGGLFVTGYCSFIHRYYRTQGLDKLLFLSRDGDILMQVYQKLYPRDYVSYAYWSRKAAAKLMADEDRHDYFRRFIYHKVNQSYTVAQALHSMELDVLLEKLENWKDTGDDTGDRGQKAEIRSLKDTDLLTDKNADSLRRFIHAHWELVKSVYAGQQKAAETYYRDLLENCKKAAAVDIGWAGSGSMALSHLAKHVWKIDCEITGLIAGTNTLHNAQPDASDPFLQDGRLVAYLYSPQHNRDLLKKHNPSRDYNVFWELLLSSPTPQFAGFYDGRNEKQTSDQYLDELDLTLCFGKYDANQDGIREIQRGILDFAELYRKHFGDPVQGPFPWMYQISGRDAYAPMLVAASYREKYLRMIEKRFALEINVV